MTVSISRSSFLQTFSCVCLLDMFIVWHASFPVTPVMFRPCLHVLFLAPLIVWHVCFPVICVCVVVFDIGCHFACDQQCPCVIFYLLTILL